jgi:hypothetical protein
MYFLCDRIEAPKRRDIHSQQVYTEGAGMFLQVAHGIQWRKDATMFNSGQHPVLDVAQGSTVRLEFGPRLFYFGGCRCGVHRLALTDPPGRS